MSSNRILQQSYRVVYLHDDQQVGHPMTGHSEGSDLNEPNAAQENNKKNIVQINNMIFITTTMISF